MRAPRNLAWVVTAQFLGALADGALILVAIQVLDERQAPGWTRPALRISFYVTYVLLAAFAGAAADAWPKQRVLVGTGLVKLCGCALLVAGVHPLAAYAFIGFGAVAHAPARYGILAELVPVSALVAANGWMEAATVSGSLLGMLMGSALVSPWMPIPQVTTGLQGAAVLSLIYLVAVAAYLPVQAGAAADAHALRRPGELVGRLYCSVRRLAGEHEVVASLVVTSLFWATAAVLQFVVLRWAAQQLGLPISGAALLHGLFAAGLVGGTAAAGRWVAAADALRCVPAGIAAGIGVAVVALVTQRWAAATVLACIGLLAGVLLVPMNALLQARSARLMAPGQAIAAQHFCENLASVVLLAVYGALTILDVPVRSCLVALGSLVIVTMAALWSGHRGKQADRA